MREQERKDKLAKVTGKAKLNDASETISTPKAGGRARAQDKTVAPENNAPDIGHGKYQEKLNTVAYVREVFSEKLGKKPIA
jgi:hypothetical protein